MIFYFKHGFIVFNVIEHLTVPFVELARGGSSVCHFRFFCLLWITCLSIIPTVTQGQSYLLLEIFPATCIFRSVCLCG